MCSCLLLHWKLLPGHWVIALIALMWNSGQVYADVDVFYLFKFEVLGKTADSHMEIVQNVAFWDQSEKKTAAVVETVQKYTMRMLFMGRAARFNQVWYFIFNIRTPGLHLVQYTRSRLNERSKRLKAPKTPALWRYNTLRLCKKGLKFLFQQNPPERSVPQV